MGTIIQFLKEQNAFDPEATSAMSEAFEAACRALKLPEGDANGREAIAAQIIELARRGETRRNATSRLRVARCRRRAAINPALVL